jgi:hypothetical protein
VIVKGIFDVRPVIRRSGRTGGWNWLVVGFLWILLGPTAMLRAQGVRYDNIVLGPRGGPVGAATIAVCSSSATTATTPCSPLATIYSDEALTQPLANPMQADSLGNYGFWAPPGHYVVQIYGTGVTTRTMNVFLPCDPSNCSMANATFSSITAGTLNLTGSLTVNGRGVATEAKSNDAVLYVSPNGSDSSDGLSWGSAKKTLYAAVAAVENSTVAGGTLYVAANTACGGPVSGQGLWLIGDNDPNHSSPPSGWIYADWPLRIIGVGTTTWYANASGGAVNLNCGSGTAANLPGLWLSGTNRPFYFANLAFPTNDSSGLRMGIDTTGNRASSTGATSVVFDNMQFGAQNNSVSGPAVDIGSNVFWVWFKHSLFQANSLATALSDEHQAVVINPGPSGNCGTQDGLIFFDHTVANAGGIHFYGSCQNGGTLGVNDLTTESENDGSPAVWVTTTASNLNSANYRIRNITVADATVNPTYAVKVDNTSTNSVGISNATVVSNVDGAGQSVSGPMTIISEVNQSLQNVTKEPPAEGQVGFLAGHVYGQVDAARRLFPPVASPWANLAPTLPSSWPVSSNGTLSKSYITGPDGASGSALDINQTGGTYQPSVEFIPNVTYAWAVGDYVVAGAWFRVVGGGVPVGGTALQLAVNGSCATAPIYGGQYFGGIIKGDGEWEWAAAAFKITTGGSCGLSFNGTFDNGREMQFFAPVAIHIPAGQVSDNEAADIAQNLASFPDGLNPPVEATLRGHPFAFGGSGDNFFGTLDHTALTANRTYLFPDTGGSVCLATTCGSQAGQIPISSAASGSHSFGTSYKSAPVCIVSPTSNPGSTTWWVTSSTSSVTVRTARGTSRQCQGNSARAGAGNQLRLCTFGTVNHYSLPATPHSTQRHPSR